MALSDSFRVNFFRPAQQAPHAFRRLSAVPQIGAHVQLNGAPDEANLFLIKDVVWILSDSNNDREGILIHVVINPIESD